MATIIDVSKAAGVSVATVSRVLNGSGPVRAVTARRVLDAVEALSYVPNISARNLRRDESRILLILAPNVSNPYYSRIIGGIGEVARHNGYSAFLCDTDGDPAEEARVLSMLTRRQADGAVLLATPLGADWLAPYAGRFPIVQCSEFDPAIDVVHVSIDNYAAAREAVEYLLSLGHTRVGIIGSVNHYGSTALRRTGYRDALAAAGIRDRAEYVRNAARDYSFASGQEAARGLLSQAQRPTALFCISDMLALGAIASAREMGFRVPEDVAIVGFDDVEQTTMFHPHLTTVAQPCREIGARATETLLSMLRGESVPRETVLPHRLVVRESACPRPGALDLSASIRRPINR